MNVPRKPPSVWAIVVAIVLIAIVAYLRQQGEPAAPEIEETGPAAVTLPPSPQTGSPRSGNSQAGDSQVANPPRTENAKANSARVPGGGLEAHERLGGHTLARHVGKSEADLRDRLDDQREITAASSFYSRALAEAAVAATLAAHQRKIDAWLANSREQRMEPLEYRYREKVGLSLRRGAQAAQHVSGVRVILQRDDDSPVGYHIITAYPQS